MIITKIIGGLGNQMFQYALGYTLAKKNNTVGKIDLKDYSIYTLHKYSLGHLSISLPPATAEETRPFLPTGIYSFINNASAFFRLPLRVRKKRNKKEKSFRFDPSILSLRGDYYLDGYWQSEKYFSEYADDIRKEFRVKEAPDAVNAEALRSIEQKESVAVHIRRGDYVTNKNTNSDFGVVPLEHYLSAIEIMSKRLKNPEFFVFSDDIEWAKKNLRPDVPLHFLGHNNSEKNYEDLRLMSSCKHQIIANSSFSWWGAWLNPNEKKIVIAPKRWFQALSNDTTDLLPEAWLRI